MSDKFVVTGTDTDILDAFMNKLNGWLEQQPEWYALKSLPRYTRKELARRMAKDIWKNA